MSFEIRELQVGDFNSFCTTLESLRSVESLTPEAFEQIVYGLASSKCHKIFVAVKEGVVVGTTTLFIEQKFIRNGGKVGHIEDVATHAHHKRNGIGRALIEHAIAEARRQGCYKVILDCCDDNVPFYESCGFHRHEVAMRLDFPK